MSQRANYTVYVASESALAYSATTSAVSAGVVFSMLAKKPTFLFSLINNVQALTYFPLTTVPLPEGLKSRMVSMNLQNLFSNPIDISREVKREFQLTPPQFALNYGYSDATFLTNAGIILTTYAISLGLVPILWLLSKVKWPLIATFFREVLGGYKWRNVFMHWIESYLDLSIACFIQLRVVIVKADFLFLSRARL